jgi:hypothetical protein
MANLQETYRRFIGVGACSISPIDEPEIVMAFPRLSALSIADNIEQGKIVANTETGVSAVFNTYTMSHQPELSLTYSTFNIEMQAIATGWRTQVLDADGYDAPFVRQVVVPDTADITVAYEFDAYTAIGSAEHAKTTVTGAVEFKATTQENGVTIDISDKLEVFDNGAITVKQVNVAELLGAAITVEIFGTYSGGAITVAKPLGNVSITAGIVTSNNKNMFLYVPVAKVNTTGNSFDPAADNKEIKFDILSIGGCDPYKLIEMPLGVTCA